MTGKTARLSRRTAVRAGASVSAVGAALGLGTAVPRAAVAQDGAWRRETLSVLFTPVDTVSITLAGGGPPQRGDTFYVDGPIYAVGDVNGTRIGTYQCFGFWTSASGEPTEPTQRLTTVQFLMDDGSIMGLINEFGNAPVEHVGAVQGGTGAYFGALGTFQQIEVPTEEAPASPAAATPMAGTPNPGQFVVEARFDLLLPPAS
jgi:hypothetical protein